MSLIDFIQKLQKKPRYVRIQLLWLSVFISMSLIVPLWIVSLKHFSPVSRTAGEKEETAEEFKTKILPIKESLKANIGSFSDLFGDEDEVPTEGNNDEIKPAKLPLR